MHSQTIQRWISSIHPSFSATRRNWIEDNKTQGMMDPIEKY